jgi:hypothetical protein
LGHHGFSVKVQGILKLIYFFEKSQTALSGNVQLGLEDDKTKIGIIFVPRANIHQLVVLYLLLPNFFSLTILPDRVGVDRA